MYWTIRQKFLFIDIKFINLDYTLKSFKLFKKFKHLIDACFLLRVNVLSFIIDFQIQKHQSSCK